MNKVAYVCIYLPMIGGEALVSDFCVLKTPRALTSGSSWFKTQMCYRRCLFVCMCVCVVSGYTQKKISPRSK